MIERYEEYLKYELNYSNYTIKEYIIHVKEFLFYCDENKIGMVCRGQRKSCKGYFWKFI